ncbi:hypothetical protein Tco_1301431 [Tanacetum coccineum]
MTEHTSMTLLRLGKGNMSAGRLLAVDDRFKKELYKVSRIKKSKSTWSNKVLGIFLSRNVIDFPGYREKSFFCHKVLEVSLSFKCDKVLQEVFNFKVLVLKKFLIRGSAIETGLLDFLAFMFVNDKVAAGGYRQVKFLEFSSIVQGAQGDREAEVFQVSNDDTAIAQRRLEDKQPEEKTNTDYLVKEQENEYQTGWKIKTGNVLDSCNQRSPSSAIGFKKPRDMLGFFGWLASIEQGMLEPVKVKCIFLGYHKRIVGNKLWRLDDIYIKGIAFTETCFNESEEYKTTFIGSVVGSGKFVCKELSKGKRRGSIQLSGTSWE